MSTAISRSVASHGWSATIRDCPATPRCARVAQLALIDGAAGAVWAPGGQPRVAFTFSIAGGQIVAIDILADPERLGLLDVEIVND